MMKKKRVLALLTVLALLSSILVGCGSNANEKAIKDKCEEMMAGANKSSEEEWLNSGFKYTYSKPQTSVAYNENTNRFTCTVSVDQTITLISDPSEVTEFKNVITFFGYMDGEKVIIDDFKTG